MIARGTTLVSRFSDVDLASFPRRFGAMPVYLCIRRSYARGLRQWAAASFTHATDRARP